MSFKEIISEGKLILQSQVNGAFQGFNDKKLFPLANGQFWIQNKYKYWYNYAYRPVIKVYKYQNRNYLIKLGSENFVEVKKLIQVIRATIINDFNGWSGNTIFELDNGQIWKQDEYDYDYNYSYRPEAIIYESGYGYKITVEGKSVGVKRLK